METQRIQKTAEIAKDEAEKIALDSAELAENVIFPLLAGKGPEFQGAVLANLLATFLLGHHPPHFRGLILQMHMATVLDLVKLESVRRGE